MKLAGIIFLIATIVYFLIKLKKTENEGGKSEINKTSTEKKESEENDEGWLKRKWKSLIVWAIILHFIVLNLIYPGEWFEVKKIFWFFAPRISGKYAALKEHKDIVEKDKKKKLSDIQAEIKKFEQVKDLSVDDIKKLNNLKKQAGEINDVYSETKTAKPASAKPETKTKSVWVARLSADRKQIEEAMHMGVSQAANDKIEIGEALKKTDIEIRFSYKKRGKTHEVILTRENAELEHYYGIIDLSDNTQLELWLKEKGLESYKGHARQIIKRGEEIIYTPLIKASLRKEIIIS